MTLPSRIELWASILMLAALGCGARPSKPVPTLLPNSAENSAKDAAKDVAGGTANNKPDQASTASTGQTQGVEPARQLTPLPGAPDNRTIANANPNTTPNSNTLNSNTPSGSNTSGTNGGTNTGPNTASTAQPKSKPAGPGQPQPAITPVRDDSGTKSWLPSNVELPIEYWEAQYYNAQRIGLTHYRIEAASKQEIAIRIETNMQIQRGGQTVRQKVVVETKEQPDGQLKQFKETLSAGSLVTDTTWNFNPKEMSLQKENVDRNLRKSQPWPAGSWGPLGIHQLLLRSPMRPGETRQADVFMPQMHKRALVTLVAGKPESTTTLSGILPDMVPVEVLMQLETEGIHVRMWVDSLGRVQKTIWPEGLNLSSFRITVDEARKLQAEDELSSQLSTVVPADKVSIDPAQAVQVDYEVKSSEADPIQLFSQTTNQKAKTRFVFETVVTVARPDWQGPAPFDAPPTPPGADERTSSTLLPSEHPQLVQLATQWSGQAATDPQSDSVDVARRLLEACHQHVRPVNGLATIRPVPTVAQSLDANCAEHAMLLVALLRNRQIAARLASGIRMRARDGQTEFAYHMWVEAWLNDKWVPMDPTTGQLTSCAYLKFLHTALTDNDPYQPVLSVLRKLKLLRIIGASGQ